jgi:hypothetical protein
VVTYKTIKERNKKAEVLSSACSSMLVNVLLSPKGPPSCWRAKPIIKTVLGVYVYDCMVAEHVINPILAIMPVYSLF